MKEIHNYAYIASVRSDHLELRGAACCAAPHARTEHLWLILDQNTLSTEKRKLTHRQEHGAMAPPKTQRGRRLGEPVPRLQGKPQLIPIDRPQLGEGLAAGSKEG